MMDTILRQEILHLRYSKYIYFILYTVYPWSLDPIHIVYKMGQRLLDIV